MLGLLIFISAELDVNVARGKPTFASSVWCDNANPNQCGGPELAVDGNYDTYFYNYSCFAGYDHPNGPNWWAVDMRLLVFVDQVIVTNRAEDCTDSTCGESLH